MALSLRCASPTSLLQLNTRIGSCFKRSAAFGRRRSIQRPISTIVDSASPLRDKLRHLVQPIIATMSTVGVTYGFYKTFKMTDEQRREIILRRLIYNNQPSERRTWNDWWKSRYGGEKLIYGVIVVNVSVFLAWTRPSLHAVLEKYFLSSLYGPARTVSLYGCMFSHINSLHVLVNMYVLHSMGQAIKDPALFTHLYISGGMVSGLASYLATVFLPRGASRSLGASGAILSVVGYICLKYPESKFAVALINEIYPHRITASTLLMFLLAFDTCGLLAGWQFFDHAAHLGGVIYGACCQVTKREMAASSKRKSTFQVFNPRTFGWSGVFTLLLLFARLNAYLEDKDKRR